MGRGGLKNLPRFVNHKHLCHQRFKGLLPPALPPLTPRPPEEATYPETFQSPMAQVQIHAPTVTPS